MAILDAVAKSAAVPLIGGFGKRLTLQMVTSEFDAATGANVETEPFGSPFTVRGVVEPFGTDTTQFDGEVIRAGDQKVSIANTATLTLEPKPGHYLWFPEEDTAEEDVRYTIKAVQRVYGGDNVAMFVCLARR